MLYLICQRYKFESKSQLLDEIHAALCCMEGETFKEFDLVESDTNHNHEEIVENIEVYRCVAIKSMQ